MKSQSKYKISDLLYRLTTEVNGKEVTSEAAFTPETTSDMTLLWDSYNDSVAMVYGGKVANADCIVTSKITMTGLGA